MELICFRSNKRWVTAAKLLTRDGTLPVLFSRNRPMMSPKILFSPALLNLQHSGIARMVGRENHKKRAHTAVYGFQFLSLLCSLVLMTLSSN